MKVGVLTSSVLHGSILALGFISLSAPEPYTVKEVESVQIELVSVSDFAQAVQGAQEAPLINTPRPEETKADPISNVAENIGEANDDTQSVVAEEQAPVAVKQTAPPKVDSIPVPAPKVSPTPTPVKEPAPAPAVEIANENKVEVAPKPETKEAKPEQSSALTEEAVAVLPESVPIPAARPAQPKVQKATTTDRKVPQTQTADATTAPKTQIDAQADEVAALINREKSKAGGAKRVTGQKSLGTENKSTGVKLSRGEEEALRNHYENCFQIALLENFAGVDEVSVSVLVNFDQSGQIVGKPTATASGGDRTAQRHAMRSIVRDIIGCKNPPLPPSDKYSTWSQVKLNYSMSEILNAGF